MKAITLPIPTLPPAGSQNRRSHERIDYHTAVTVVWNGPGGFSALRARSNDVSPGGAKIICDEEIVADTLFLRILIPELADKFVEAKIVNSSIETVERIGNVVTKRFIYNARFTQFVSDQAMLDVLRVAAGIPAQT